MKYVMFYELATDGLSKVHANFPAHQARLKEFHQNGTLLMAGPYGAPPWGHWLFSPRGKLLRLSSLAIRSY